jgi:hypothetical protein
MSHLLITGDDTFTRGVRIGTYGGNRADNEPEDENRIVGYIEPAHDNPSWILWFTRKGEGMLYTERAPDGGVIGEPIRLKAKP